MELRDREFFIYRIAAGYTKYVNRDTALYTHNPTIEELYDAKEYELEAYNDALFSGMYQEEEIKEELRSFGIWTKKDDAKVEGLPKEIENLKVKMFENLMRSNAREKLRTHVRRAEQQLEETLLKKAQYDMVTCEGYAAFIRSSWLIENCTRLKDGSKCDWDQFDFFSVMNNYFQIQPTEKEIREIAKTEPFRTSWGASKERIFDQVGVEMTDSQKGLVLWSKMYDGIHENPDCPAEDVIQDDDLLDGWLIYDRRKRESERNKNSAEQYDMDADEIFIPIETDEDLRRVDGMNDETSKMVVNQRHKQIQDAQSPLKHSDLTDVRRDLQMQANEQYKNKVKG